MSELDQVLEKGGNRIHEILEAGRNTNADKVDTSSVNIKDAVDTLADPTAIKRVKINIRIDTDRMKSHVSTNELIEIESGKMGAQVAVMSKFVYKDGEYLDADAGRELIGKMSLGQLNETIAKFLETMQVAASTGPK